jgi:hypothetical protein
MCSHDSEAREGSIQSWDTEQALIRMISGPLWQPHGGLSRQPSRRFAAVRLAYNGRMAVKQRNPGRIGPADKGGKKGVSARAARLTPEPRSENTRKAVPSRPPKGENSGFGDGRESTSAHSLSASKQALHICLKRLKDAKNESEISHLTDELQMIVFHKQYRNAENEDASAGSDHGPLGVEFSGRPDFGRRFRRVARLVGIRSGCPARKMV